MSAISEMGFNQNNFNDFSKLNNSSNFFNFNNGSNFNNPFINNNFTQMPTMMQNNMNNFNNFNYYNNFNTMNQMNNFSQCFPMNYNSFIQNQPFNMNINVNIYDYMNANNKNGINNMTKKMNDIKLNDNSNINKVNSINNNNFNSIQPMYNGTNSMNNIQPNYCMNNSMNQMSISNNQNPMNNMINSVNMNLNNNMDYYNNFNYMNNYFSNNISGGGINNLSSSYNNISLSNNSDDFIIGQEMNKNLTNTCKTSINDMNIVLTFTTSETFSISCKQNEKFSNIITKFKNDQCPEKLLKANWKFYLHNGRPLDTEKTLKELNVFNGSRILIITENNEDTKKKENKKENKNSDVNNSQAQSSPSGIIIKEHIHNLVYCLNNFSWKCNLCKIKYEKKIPKYYCSICNFSLCEKCHEIRNYPKKKAFPDEINNSNISVQKKFLKTVYHKHYLVYSRTSRDSDELKQWYCNNCKETFDNNVWSFYCTKCDFDLCTKCAGYN